MVNKVFKFIEQQVLRFSRSICGADTKTQERLLCSPNFLHCSVFRGHLWARLFPPVPAPKNSLKDFLVIVSPEVMLKALMMGPICSGLGLQGLVIRLLVLHIPGQNVYPGGPVT